jgi:hypothetical protein
MAAFSSAFAAWALTGAIGGMVAGKKIGAAKAKQAITADAPTATSQQPPPIPTAQGLAARLPRVQTPNTPRPVKPGQVAGAITSTGGARRKPPTVGGWSGSARTRLSERSIAGGGY